MLVPAFHLPAELARAHEEALSAWRASDGTRRLWERDATLWTGSGEEAWLDWLHVVSDQRAGVERLARFSGEVREEGYRHALLLGMGGSSLCPEVLSLTFARGAGHPELVVLDSTDPAQVRGLEGRLDAARTLVIVSSKSGSTLEPDILLSYVFDKARRAAGPREAASRFVAVTDPGSTLERAAREDGFRRVFHGVPGIGGRYSALSDFGLVPAAVMGLDVPRLLERAERMARACGAPDPEENPGISLGLLLGAAARAGRDKLTLAASPGIAGLGSWLEQLLAESTGKSGQGIVPVDREGPAPPDRYGDDRLFVYCRLSSDPDAAQDASVEALQRAGHPVVRIAVEDPYDLGQEFFRWEIATAAAGAVLGINPFDQPDVEASKVATRELTSDYERTGALPVEAPAVEESGLKLFADDANAGVIAGGAGRDQTPAGWLRAHLARLRPGDYFCLCAFLERSAGHEEALQAIRRAVRDRRRVATTLGFGPRFLHSTGQLHKGGPNTGVFLQVTCDDALDLPVPGRRYTFGVVKAAQARGDLRVLSERSRRVLRVHLGSDVAAGLAALRAAVERALA